MEKQRIRKNRITILILAIPLCLFFGNIVSAMEKPEWEKWEAPGTPVRGGEYRLAATVDVGLLNPHHWPVLNWKVIDMMMEQHIVAADKVIFNPWLASSWHYRNPTTFVIKFREGIYFHDGSPLNAAVAKYNFEWILEKKNGCWDRSYITAIKSMHVEDEYTLAVKFKKPFAIFLAQLQMPPGYAISVNALKGDLAIREAKKLATKIKTAKKKLAKAEKKAKKAAAKGEAAIKKAGKKVKKTKKALAKLEKKFAKASKLAAGAKETDVYPVGTGPYMFDSRSSGNWIRVKRNPKYWYGKTVGRPNIPYFDSVRIDVIPDSSVQLANLRVGKIHEMQLSPSLYNMLSYRKDPSIRVDSMRMLHSEFVELNHAKGPCRDIRVRKAISHAIDRKALLFGVRFGLGELASCIFPGKLWSHNPNLSPVAYDPELSRRLLKEAGYGDGLTIKGHSLNTPEFNTLASALKNMLEKVGIDWRYEMLGAVAANDRKSNLEFDVTLTRWPAIYDPDMPINGLYYEPAGINAGRSNNKKAIELIEAGRVEHDLERRKRIYWELEKVLYDNYEDAWLWWPKKGRAFHHSVRGTDAKMAERFNDAWTHAHMATSMWFEK
ncbi:MAG: ABC transporter substrate-binding protein [bacterium]|nr:ABC transporter substrate-binding protein [bacterium]